MYLRFAKLSLCAALTLSGVALPTYAKHHKGEAPETHKSGGDRSKSNSIAKPAKKGPDDPATHDAKDDKGQNKGGKDDPAGHH